MSKTVLFLFLLVAGSTLYAQKNRVEFGLELGYGLSGTNFQYDLDPAGIYSATKNNLGLRDAQGISLFIRYYLGTHLSLQLGAGYLAYGFRQKKFAVNGLPPAPYYPVASVVALESKTTFRDVVMPLELRYGKSVGAWRWYLMGGLAPQIKLERRKADKAYYDNGDDQTLTYKDSYGKTFNLSGRIGAGIELPLLRGVYLYLQPTAGYGFLNNYHTEMASFRPYFFMLNIGFIY